MKEITIKIKVEGFEEAVEEIIFAQLEKIQKTGGITMHSLFSAILTNATKNDITFDAGDGAEDDNDHCG